MGHSDLQPGVVASIPPASLNYSARVISQKHRGEHVTLLKE